MKKCGYYIFNTIIFLALVAVIDFAIYENTAITRAGETWVETMSFTDEEIIEEHNDNELFNEALDFYSDRIKEDKEELNNLEIGTDKYNELANSIELMEKNKVELSLYNSLLPEANKEARNKSIITDIIMIVIYVVGMIIFVKFKNRKKSKRKNKK